MTDDRREARRVPMAAAALGGAGLLPPLIAIVARATAGAGDPLARFAVLAGLSYVTLILSFLGGMWWGIAAAKLSGEQQGRWLLVAVVPSLAGLALQIASGWFPGPATLALAAVLIATLVVDRRLAAGGLAPRWWMRLRAPLSIGLAIETAVLSALLR